MRKRKYESVRREVEGITDATGRKVDPGIKPVVIGLRTLGINTVSSCEGHRGRRRPQVSVGGENLPELVTRQHRLLDDYSPSTVSEMRVVIEEMEAGRMAQRGRVEPLITEFNQSRGRGRRLEIKHETPGMDRISPQRPSLVQRLLGRGLSQEQRVMQDFGWFLGTKRK